MYKRFLIWAGTSLLALALFAWVKAGAGSANAHEPVATPPDAPAPVIPVPSVKLDIDAMAARMKNYQSTYRQIRDDSLAAFAKAHPKTPVDAQVKAFFGIAAYLWVWGDRYGEGLWQTGEVDAEAIMAKAIPEWEANIFLKEHSIQSYYSAADSAASYSIFAADNVIKSDYPFELKMQACEFVLKDLSDYKTEGHADPQSRVFVAMPIFLTEWGKGFRQMIKGKFTHEQLADTVSKLFCCFQFDQAMLDCAIAEVDEDFNETDPSNPVKIAMDGEYWDMAAGAARGGGWASSVSDEGWRLFSERLTKADNILEDAWVKYPNEGEIARFMIDVELGQGQGRERMELWFKRAIAIDPNDYAAYKAKEWYLQPRWHGSLEDIISFGQECVATDRWDANIPMIFTIGVAEISEQQSDVYQDSKLWGQLESTYREYLKRFPQSIMYRTNFAKHAYDSGRLDTAREQFKILGDNWDRDVVDGKEHAQIMSVLNGK